MGPLAAVVAAEGRRPAGVADAVRSLPGVVDVVVGADSVVVVVDDPAALGPVTSAAACAGVEPAGGAGGSGPVVEIPVTYDGPDLADVASRTGLSEAEVVEAHAGARYEVAFVGFAPGFGYLRGLPDVLRLPRRSSPRDAVPAGSVAIADAWSAVYPRVTPGGWHLLGRTDEVLFDPERRPPALLAPGVEVRFVPDRPRRRPVARPGPSWDAEAPPPGRAGGSAVGEPAVEVVEAGPLTTVQDRGRPGRAALGVPPSGAADGAAARLANRLVGNDEGAAVLEATLAGPTLVLRGDATRSFAVTGGPGPIGVDGAPRAADGPFDVRPGQAVAVGAAVVGLRRYVAVSGGFTPPATLGSRSTDLLTGLGPPPLATGDLLAVGPDTGRRAGVDVAPVALRPAAARLRTWPGPHRGWLTAGGARRLGEGPWVVAPSSNRVGIRLDGPDLARARSGEVPSLGLVAGAVQLTPSGQLVVFGPDHPVTGGYPVVAVVDPDDLDLLAQLRPGEEVTLAGGA
jgi:KipI family sensor histidine kinase inhibitor